MSDAMQASHAKTELASDLAAGVQQLSLNQTIVFTLYARVVLPIDGYVFWVRSDLLSAAALLAAGAITGTEIEQTQMVRARMQVMGSLHYATQIYQDESETYAIDQVVFTSLQEVQDLNAVSPTLLYIGEFDGRRFAFSSRKSFYRQAGLWHYVGNAIYPDMETQVIDDIEAFSTAQVVSNSLPGWLAFNGFSPAYGFRNPGITLYPSFLSPENLAPPFGTVHIDPATTKAHALAPTLDPATSSHYQLCSEQVRVTLWGARNTNAMDFVDAINQYTLSLDAPFGLMNNPAMRDEKRTQAELATIAMKKSILYEVSYLQTRINTVGQQIIKKAIPSYTISRQ
jgi:hypothetical protein